ncbi:MAG: capsule biosynthesis protein [Paracoccus sp. (in: a-proteobacteria)]
MTTPPKVKIYRNKRRNSAQEDQAEAGRHAAQVAAEADQAVRAGQTGSAAPVIADMETQIETVKAEGLTGRQLRLARRIATMHGIDAESDEAAVVILRSRGVNPFHRSALSQVVSNTANGGDQAPRGKQVALQTQPKAAGQPAVIGQITPAQLPAHRTPLPSREALTEEKRAAEIMRIQRDIAHRRRIKVFWLSVRLFLLVGIPTVIAGWYYFAIATPLYEANSQFLIQQADTASLSAGASALAGIQMSPDSVAVQSYLTSKNAMLRLDEEVGFKSAFQDPALDPLLRLPPDASDDDAYKVYKDMVSVGYDPTEGVLNMDVIAPAPKLSEEYSLALISYAEGMVDDMTARVRSDQMEGAEQNYTDADDRVLEAQGTVQDLQEQLGVLDPASESGLVMNRIGQLETELTQKQLELAQLQSNPRPNTSRVQGVEGDIQRLRELISETRLELTEGNGARGSLAQISGRLRIAEADLETRQALLASAAEQLEMARIEANKQVRYLSLSVAPVPPEDATYPKALTNTIVAFLVFLGIYLMLSLTASILREQVST